MDVGLVFRAYDVNTEYVLLLRKTGRLLGVK